METSTESTFGELERWQAMLERHDTLFTEMSPGSSVAT